MPHLPKHRAPQRTVIAPQTDIASFLGDIASRRYGPVSGFGADVLPGEQIVGLRTGKGGKSPWRVQTPSAPSGGLISGRPSLSPEFELMLAEQGEDWLRTYTMPSDYSYVSPEDDEGDTTAPTDTTAPPLNMFEFDREAAIQWLVGNTREPYETWERFSDEGLQAQIETIVATSIAGTAGYSLEQIENMRDVLKDVGDYDPKLIDNLPADMIVDLVKQIDIPTAQERAQQKLSQQYDDFWISKSVDPSNVFEAPFQITQAKEAGLLDPGALSPQLSFDEEGNPMVVDFAGVDMGVDPVQWQQEQLQLQAAKEAGAGGGSLPYGGGDIQDVINAVDLSQPQTWPDDPVLIQALFAAKEAQNIPSIYPMEERPEDRAERELQEGLFSFFPDWTPEQLQSFTKFPEQLQNLLFQDAAANMVEQRRMAQEEQDRLRRGGALQTLFQDIPAEILGNLSSGDLQFLIDSGMTTGMFTGGGLATGVRR